MFILQRRFQSLVHNSSWSKRQYVPETHERQPIKAANKEVPDRCWRKDRKPHWELFSVFIIHSLTCFMQA